MSETVQTPHPSDLPPAFLELMETTPIEMKHLMLAYLQESICKSETALPTKAEVTVEEATPLSSYVEHVGADSLGMTDELYHEVCAELKSLGLKSSNAKKMKTQWLSPSSEAYNYIQQCCQ